VSPVGSGAGNVGAPCGVIGAGSGGLGPSHCPGQKQGTGGHGGSPSPGHGAPPSLGCGWLRLGHRPSSAAPMAGQGSAVRSWAPALLRHRWGKCRGWWGVLGCGWAGGAPGVWAGAGRAGGVLRSLTTCKWRTVLKGFWVKLLHAWYHTVTDKVAEIRLTNTVISQADLKDRESDMYDQRGGLYPTFACPLRAAACARLAVQTNRAPPHVDVPGVAEGNSCAGAGWQAWGQGQPTAQLPPELQLPPHSSRAASRRDQAISSGCYCVRKVLLCTERGCFSPRNLLLSPYISMGQERRTAVGCKRVYPMMDPECIVPGWLLQKT